MLTPGANVLLVSHLAASGNRRSACYAALGISMGAAIWSSAALLGVSILFVTFPMAHLCLQMAGAFYLLYVAMRLWRTQEIDERSSQPQSAVSSIRAGLFTNLSNPKSALFFGGVFSTVMPVQPNDLMLVAAVILVVGNALCWHLLLAFLFSSKRLQSYYGTKRKMISRSAGVLIGTLGLTLLVASIREALK